jgi:fumarylacetoacetate (FAA) hydrolase
MKLASIDNGTRDGELVVAADRGKGSRDNVLLSARDIAPSLQAALDNWSEAAAGLRELARNAPKRLERVPSEVRWLAPLPRAYEWIDGSAYIHHVRLVRKARGAEPPETLETDPLVYQGGSGVLLGPHDEIALPDPAWGLDFESEICVVLKDTPRGTRALEAGEHIALLMLANDLTFRNLTPGELKKGFGFFQSKPATAFSPFAITPDELGPAWTQGRVHLTLRTRLNGTQVGATHAGPEMHFSFFELIEHICKTRSFTAGTILGSGTVSNQDEARGVSCLAEQRMREIIRSGKATTPFLAVGDRVTIDMQAEDGSDLFGTIDQVVVGDKGIGS